MACHDTSDLQERHVDVGPAFVANPQAAERVLPTDRLLHDPTQDTPTAAVFSVSLGHGWCDVSLGRLLKKNVP